MARAQRILEAAGGTAGGGVVMFEGQSIWMPAIRQVEIRVHKAERMGM